MLDKCGATVYDIGVIIFILGIIVIRRVIGRPFYTEMSGGGVLMVFARFPPQHFVIYHTMLPCYHGLLNIPRNRSEVINVNSIDIPRNRSEVINVNSIDIPRKRSKCYCVLMRINIAVTILGRSTYSVNISIT